MMSRERSYINEFLRRNNEAVMREVERMLQHPLTREQKIAQIQRLRAGSASTKFKVQSASGAK